MNTEWNISTGILIINTDCILNMK